MAQDSPPIMPARIVRQLKDHVDDPPNLQVTPDMHWIFMRSLRHKDQLPFKHHCGKWKYDASDNDDLLAQACRLLPLIVDGMLPVVKTTNIGNVFSGERLIVVYCFREEAKSAETGELLEQMFKGRFYWGSEWFSTPLK